MAEQKQLRGRVVLWTIFLALLAYVGAAMLFPPRPTIHRARQVKCASNLRQIGMALSLYTKDAGSPQYPPGLELLVEKADVGPDVFVCPAAGDQKATGATTRQRVEDFLAGKHCSYVYVGAKLTAGDSAAHVVAYEPLSNHGGVGANVLYNDGSVARLEKAEAARVIAELEAGHNPPRRSTDKR
jgi:prepilin-type processing-associated H-X9-DG protein